jgi:hypothetical protein
MTGPDLIESLKSVGRERAADVAFCLERLTAVLEPGDAGDLGRGRLLSESDLRGDIQIAAYRVIQQ